MAAGDMKQLEQPPVDLSGWCFGFGDLDGPISKGVQEAITNVLRDSPPRLTLPVIWTVTDGRGGTRVDDPATIYLHLPFDIETDRECTWSLSLGELIEDWFEMDEDGPHSSHTPTAQRLALRLREIADRLDPPSAKP